MTRTFTLKQLSGAQHTFDDDGCSNLDEFIQKVLDGVDGWNEKYGTIKLVWSGKQLDNESYEALANGQQMIVVPIKAKPVPKEPEPTPAPAPVATENTESTASAENAEGTVSTDTVSGNTFATADVTPTEAVTIPSNPSPSDDVNATFTREQCRISTMVVMNFIRENPQLKEMFLNDFDSLIAHYNGPQLRGIYDSILDQSAQMLESAQNGGTIAVNIQGDSSGVNEINLTSEDQEKIQSLVNMGFPQQLVVQIYVKSGNNFDVALEQLLQMGML